MTISDYTDLMIAEVIWDARAVGASPDTEAATGAFMSTPVGCIQMRVALSVEWWFRMGSVEASTI